MHSVSISLVSFKFWSSTSLFFLLMMTGYKLVSESLLLLSPVSTYSIAQSFSIRWRYSCSSGAGVYTPLPCAVTAPGRGWMCPSRNNRQLVMPYCINQLQQFPIGGNFTPVSIDLTAWSWLHTIRRCLVERTLCWGISLGLYLKALRRAVSHCHVPLQAFLWFVFGPEIPRGKKRVSVRNTYLK